VVRARRLERQLSSAELDLFDYPQNAWGGENTFLYILKEAFGFAAQNPCLTLRVVHMHCAMPTQFGTHVVGDKRLGKKEITTRAQAKMRKMGIRITMDVKAVGTMTLNVTSLPNDASVAPPRAHAHAGPSWTSWTRHAEPI